MAMIGMNAEQDEESCRLWKDGEYEDAINYELTTRSSHRGMQNAMRELARMFYNELRQSQLRLSQMPEVGLGAPGWEHFTCHFVPKDGAKAAMRDLARNVMDLAQGQTVEFGQMCMPRGLMAVERISNWRLGFSLSMWREHDILNDCYPARFDVVVRLRPSARDKIKRLFRMVFE